MVQKNKYRAKKFLKEDVIRKLTKVTLLTKSIHICTSHHQLHIQTLYIMQNEVFTMVKKHLSNGTAIEESGSTYVRGLSKINANILGI